MLFSLFSLCLPMAFNLNLSNFVFEKLSRFETHSDFAAGSITHGFGLPDCRQRLFRIKSLNRLALLEALGYLTLLGRLPGAIALILFILLVEKSDSCVCSSVTYIFIPDCGYILGVFNGEDLLLAIIVGIAAWILGVMVWEIESG